MKKITLCLMAMAAVLFTGCEKKEIKTDKVLDIQLVLNDAVTNYYSFELVYTMPNGTETKEEIKFEDLTESNFPDIYTAYKDKPQYGKFHCYHFTKTTQEYGDGKFQIIPVRGTNPISQGNTIYYFINYCWSAGEKGTTAKHFEEKTGSINGANYEGFIKPYMVQTFVEQTFNFPDPNVEKK